MRDDQRHHPAPPPVAPAEDDAHREVADDRTDALVRVIGPAQGSGGQDDRPPRPSETAEAVEQVRDEDDLFGQPGPHRGQQKQRHRPPCGIQRRGHDRDVQPQYPRDHVEAEPRNPDDGCEQDAAPQVTAEPREVEADPAKGVVSRVPQQVEDHGHQGEGEHDAEELVEDVPEDLGIPIGVELSLLLADRRRAQRGSHQRQDRIQSRLPNRDGQNDADLPPQACSGGRFSGIPHIRGARRRGHLVRLPHSRSIELRLCNVFASRFEHPTQHAYRFPIRVPADSVLSCAHNPAQEEM